MLCQKFLVKVQNFYNNKKVASGSNHGNSEAFVELYAKKVNLNLNVFRQFDWRCTQSFTFYEILCKNALQLWKRNHPLLLQPFTRVKFSYLFFSISFFFAFGLFIPLNVPLESSSQRKGALWKKFRSKKLT